MNNRRSRSLRDAALRCVSEDYTKAIAKAIALAAARHGSCDAAGVMSVDAREDDMQGCGDLVDELGACTRQLEALCADADSDTSDHDETLSAEEIANECLALLASLHTAPVHEAANEGPAPDRSTTAADCDSLSRKDIMDEIEEFDNDLQLVMASLGMHAPTVVVETPHLPHKNRARQHTPKTPVHPNLQALTKRLERRLSTSENSRRLVHRRVLSSRSSKYSLGIDKPEHVTEGRSDSRSKPARPNIVTDSSFWRHYQSKSFQQHIGRQAQARQLDAAEKAKEQKAIEYRYRKSDTTTYPLAKKRARPEDGRDHPLAIGHAPSSSYLRRYAPREIQEASSGRPESAPVQPDGQSVAIGEMQGGDEAKKNTFSVGLLLGVHWYGCRQKGILYLTSSSLKDLKARVQARAADKELLNLYRERVSRSKTGKARRFYQRVSHFSDLHNGDLLCATSHPSEDMAILCSWIKQRQQHIHHRNNAIQNAKLSAEVRLPTAPLVPTTAPREESKSGLGVTHNASQPHGAKLWDENGRLVGFNRHLPI